LLYYTRKAHSLTGLCSISLHKLSMSLPYIAASALSFGASSRRPNNKIG
jgi:hypothetical protein